MLKLLLKIQYRVTKGLHVTQLYVSIEYLVICINLTAVGFYLLRCVWCQKLYFFANTINLKSTGYVRKARWMFIGPD